MLVEFFFRLPIPIQVIVMFSGWFILLFVFFGIGRVVGIRMWGSERQYLKYDPNSITHRKIWSNSAIIATIIALIFLVSILTRKP